MQLLRDHRSKKFLLILGAALVVLLLGALLWFPLLRAPKLPTMQDDHIAYSKGFDVRLLADERIFTPSAARGHNCSITPFSQTLSANGSAPFTADLAAEQVTPFGFRIGNLPDGVTLKLGSIEQRDATHWRLPVTLRTGAEPQRGNFSIVAAYVSGKSFAICQLNLLVQP